MGREVPWVERDRRVWRSCPWDAGVCNADRLHSLHAIQELREKILWEADQRVEVVVHRQVER